MGTSRSPLRIALALAGCLSALAGCDVLLGLGDYSKCTGTNDNTPECVGTDAAADVRDSGLEADVTVVDTGLDAEAGSVQNEGGDASDAGDADVIIVPGDGAIDGPTLHEIWAHWPMPNPDASTGPESSTPLPHPMSYDAGPDVGAQLVYDNVTHLLWSQATHQVSTFTDASAYCASMGGAWRVPTRIELVSLLDFTQPATAAKIDPVAFPMTPVDSFWTSSIVPGDGGPAGYWAVSFSNGLTDYGLQASWVRCVNGGAQ